MLELLAILGFFLTHGAKIFTFLYRLARVLFAWFRLQGARISTLLKRGLQKNLYFPMGTNPARVGIVATGKS